MNLNQMVQIRSTGRVWAGILVFKAGRICVEGLEQSKQLVERKENWGKRST